MLLSRTNYLMIALGLVLLVSLGDASTAQQRLGGLGRGQGRGTGRGPGGGWGDGIRGMGTVDLLRQDAVRKELELLDDQVADLENLGEDIREMMRAAVTRLREGREQGRPGRPQDMRQVFEPISTEAQDRLAEILLPHQMKRLNQLALQARLRGGGFAMLSPDVGQQLGITEQQRDQLREKAQSIEQDLRKEIAKLRRQAQDDLITLLTPEQQAKYRELIGAPFEFPPPRRPEGPPGGREGRPGGPVR
ncbi:MAG: hypothetical protein ACC628_02960 [Pirellulaceae bacterium]